jgi:uncharacterized membrane protein
MFFRKGEMIMKYASDFRKTARDALRGKWGVAVLTGFVASLIGATIGTGGGGSSNNSSNDALNDLIPPEVLERILPALLLVLAILVIWCIVILVIGGAGKLGYAEFNLNLIDGNQAELSDLFSQFNRLGDGFCMNFLVGLYTFLWSLLFVIPGIVKAYSYAMTPYILSENPEISADYAITKSKNMMMGNRWRLFCLEISFIGWQLLYILPVLVSMPLILIGTAGFVLWGLLSFSIVFVSNLFLVPYQEAARAAFYREVSGASVPPFDPVPQEYPNVDD